MMLSKILIFLYLSIFTIGADFNTNCKKLWDMDNTANGISIYKLGIYACIENIPAKAISTPPTINDNEIILHGISNTNDTQNNHNNYLSNTTNENINKYISNVSFNNISFNNTDIFTINETIENILNKTTIILNNNKSFFINITNSTNKTTCRMASLSSSSY